jgi:hypothetical protein
MAKLTIKDLKIKFPKGFEGNPAPHEITDWLLFEMGAIGSLAMDNPLVNISLKDCDTSASEIFMNGVKMIY